MDLWRYFQAGLAGAKNQYRIKLSAGRNNAFWLIDRDGEKRQITHILFNKAGE